MTSGLTVTNYPDRPTIAYAELWAQWPFRVHPWWALPDVWYQAERKRSGVNVGWKFDVSPGPCWVVWEGEQGGYYLLKLVQAAGEDQLQHAPGDAFKPVYPGLNLMAITDRPEEPGEEPEVPEEPEPLPEPTNGRQARVLMYLPVGSPPFIVKPSAGEGRPIIKVIKTPEDHFDRLWGLLPDA